MWSFLIGTGTEIEADILIALLEQENIPAQKHFPGIGNLKATYGLISGVGIYVPEHLLAQAQELIQAEPDALFTVSDIDVPD